MSEWRPQDRFESVGWCPWSPDSGRDWSNDEREARLWLSRQEGRPVLLHPYSFLASLKMLSSSRGASILILDGTDEWIEPFVSAVGGVNAITGLRHDSAIGSDAIDEVREEMWFLNVPSMKNDSDRHTLERLRGMGLSDLQLAGFAIAFNRPSAARWIYEKRRRA